MDHFQLKILEYLCAERLVPLLQGWRMRAAQKSSSARRAQDSMNHLLLTCESQLSGHIISSDKHLTMSFENSLLHTTLDIESMRLVLLYCCEIIEAKPQTCRVEPGIFCKGSDLCIACRTSA